MINDNSFAIPKLIENLGMIYANPTSKTKKAHGIYECPFCGTYFRSRVDGINSGHTRSCGCYHLSKITKHGLTKTKLFRVWDNIKDRTTNPKNKKYPIYGGRGITICDEWKNDFIKFKDWAVANGYEEDKGLSIDRIDNDGNYAPINCRWTTINIQNRNRRIQDKTTSIFRGVSLIKSTGNFRAVIVVDSNNHLLGYFKTAIEGAIAYNNYIIENDLEGFILNIIPEEFKDTVPERITRNKKGETN